MPTSTALDPTSTAGSAGSPGSPAQPSDRGLHRMAAAAGLLSALVLVVNSAKRADVLPATAATQLLAPIAEVLAVAFVVSLYLVAGRASGRLGLASLLGFVLSFLSLASLVGVEYSINLVFAEQSPALGEALRDGPLGTAITVTSIVFLVGSVLLAGALAVIGRAPRWALAPYVVGASIVALRKFLPDAVLNVGLVVLAAGIVGLALWIWREVAADPTSA